jgi:hypothetical protein
MNTVARQRRNCRYQRVSCVGCGASFETPVWAVNRARKNAKNLYCSKACTWKHARSSNTPGWRESMQANWGGDPVARFWSNVDRRGAEECWPWTASKTEDGYGYFVDRHSGLDRAHRYSYYLAAGAFPVELFVLHRCDNPPCVNPAHLFLGTVLDNARDAVSKGRQARGSRNGNAKVSEDDVRWMRWARAYSGASAPAIARVLGLTKGHVDGIISGRAWRS